MHTNEVASAEAEAIRSIVLMFGKASAKNEDGDNCRLLVVADVAAEAGRPEATVEPRGRARAGMTGPRSSPNGVPRRGATSQPTGIGAAIGACSSIGNPGGVTTRNTGEWGGKNRLPICVSVVE